MKNILTSKEPQVALSNILNQLTNSQNIPSNTVTNNTEIWTKLISKVLVSPFVFIIIVLLIYIVLNEEKRESVNREIIKLIRAIKGGKNNLL